MAEAFTAGVRPGGLNDDLQIRILLCYLIKYAGPLPRATIEGALLQEELVNYFELVNALAALEAQQLVSKDDEGRYVITPKGGTVAADLSYDLPRSVRESAICAVIRIQSWQHKAAMNRAWVEAQGGQYSVTCAIGDLGEDVFRLQLMMPDALTAEAVKNRFIANGSKIYASLLSTLTESIGNEDEPPAAMM